MSILVKGGVVIIKAEFLEFGHSKAVFFGRAVVRRGSDSRTILDAPGNRAHALRGCSVHVRANRRRTRQRPQWWEYNTGRRRCIAEFDGTARYYVSIGWPRESL